MPKSKKPSKQRVTVALSPDEMQRLQYWADKHHMSRNEYIRRAISRSIAFENRDYDLPTAEIARLNQLRDVIVSMSTEFSSLENIIIKGFDALLGLAKGDNNYLREEDGVL